jgi:predicted component of type VI protein secretion system
MQASSPLSLFAISQLLNTHPQQAMISSAQLAFPCSDALIRNDGSLTIYSNGLLGINAPLPYAYCEWIEEQSVFHKHDAPHHFIDMLSQGMIKKNVSAWQLTRPAAIGKRPWLLLESLKQWSKTQDICCATQQLQLYFHGQVNQGPIPLETLQRIISTLTELPCNIKPFKLTRHGLSSSFRTRLSSKNNSNATSPARLGKNTFLGQHMWQRAASIEVVLGPSSITQAVALSNKQSTANGMLKSTLRHFLPITVLPSCKLKVQPPPLPMRLGQAFGSALGCNSLLGMEKKSYSEIAFKL